MVKLNKIITNVEKLSKSILNMLDEDIKKLHESGEKVKEEFLRVKKEKRK